MNGLIFGSPSILQQAGLDQFVKSLLHFNGTDGSTSFVDETGRTWTANGNAQLDTAQSKFGGASGLFDGTGDYIEASDSDDFALGTGDFTIDLWVRFNALPASTAIMPLFVQEVDGNNYYALFVYNNVGTYELYFRNRAASVNTIEMNRTITLATGTWYHIALVRSGTTFYMFKDGTQLGTTYSDADTVTDFAGVARIGSFLGTHYLNGWMDEFRFNKAIARWTANFTPNTYEY